MTKYSPKSFQEYNEYHDRGMAYKWATAFAMGELTDTIKESTNYSTRNEKRLPQQSNREIEYYLDRSIRYNKLLVLQRNTLDEFGRTLPSIEGTFRGMSEDGSVMIGDEVIEFDDIRHIKIVQFQKWSAVDLLSDPFEDLETDNLETDEFVDRFYSDDDYYNTEGENVNEEI